VRRWIVSKKDKKKLIKKINEKYGIELIGKDDKVEVVVEDDAEIYVINNIPAFIKIGGQVIPHLKFLLKRGYEWLPAIMVDQGAVMPISRGADLMRPGIQKILRPFNKGDIVVIVEPTRLLPLAVHQALYDSSEIEKMDKGKVTQRLHCLKDKYWKLAEQI
jgi:PUA-domain protein